VTAGEVAVLVVAVVGAVGVVLLSIALVAVTRALRSLQQTVELLRHDAALRVGAGGQALGLAPVAAEDGADPVARRRDAGSLLARVAVANPYLDVSDPVIKVLALASGTTRAASRLRRTRREG
jgi:hypothetical protein